MAKHMVIPDTQCKDGDDFAHLDWAGQYAAEQKPDVIIFIGDHWDMPSLSTYDKGSKGFEGRRYSKDINAGNEALAIFMTPIVREQKRQRKNKTKVWKPRLVFCLGNHEYRMERAVEKDAILEDVITYEDFHLKDWGFEVIPFLEVIVIDGVAYSHYFTSGVMGRPCASAKNMLTKKMMSCTMGHVQDREISYARRADGSRITGLFCGIYYRHDEEYLNPQTNGSWAGIWIKHEVQDGAYDEMPVSLSYLEKKYG